jgi:hypothetical protein
MISLKTLHPGGIRTRESDPEADAMSTAPRRHPGQIINIWYNVHVSPADPSPADLSPPNPSPEDPSPPPIRRHPQSVAGSVAGSVQFFSFFVIFLSKFITWSGRIRRRINLFTSGLLAYWPDWVRPACGRTGPLAPPNPTGNPNFNPKNRSW